MAGPAKVILAADVAGLKRDVAEAKRLLADVGSVKLDSKFSDQIKEKVTKQLAEGAKKLERDIKGVQDSLNKMGAAGAKAFDDTRIKNQLRSLAEMERRLKDIRNVQNQMGGGGTGGGAASGGGGGGNLGSAMSMVPGKIKIKSLLAGAVGITAIVSAVRQQTKISEERLAVRALTGGDVASAGSEFGFSEGERRQRQIDVAKAVGRDMSTLDMNRMLNEGEAAQRAHGVSAGDQAGLMGAVRRAGGDPMKSFKTAMSSTLLTGSRVTEFLQSMSQGITQMSEGVNIDSDSLMGFAGALTSLPFFKDDPSRAMKTVQNMNQAFRGGDRFQQAVAARSIRAAGGADITPAAIEFRRSMGLFGNDIDPSTLAGLGKMGMDTRALKVGGNDIINSSFNQVLSDGRDRPLMEQMNRFKNAFDLDPGAAANMFFKMGQPGGAANLTDSERDAFKKGMRSPEERMRDTFSGLDKSMMDLKSEISVLKETLAGTVSTGVTGLTDQLRAMVRGKEDEEKAFMNEMSDVSVGDMFTNPAKYMRAGAMGLGHMISGGAAKDSLQTEYNRLIQDNTTAQKDSTTVTRELKDAFIAVAREGMKGKGRGAPMPSNAKVVDGTQN